MLEVLVPCQAGGGSASMTVPPRRVRDRASMLITLCHWLRPGTRVLMGRFAFQVGVRVSSSVQLGLPA